MFAINCFLAFGWAAIHESIKLSTIALGFVLGFLVLYVNSALFGNTTYFKRVTTFASLPAYFLWELIVSSIKVLLVILTPGMPHKSGIIAYELKAKTDAEITLLACLITLTPGTMSLEISKDHRILFIHTMFADDPIELKQSIEQRLEKLVLEVMR
jgi:multicomponent Na+:H+ antiporter subunit E